MLEFRLYFDLFFLYLPLRILRSWWSLSSFNTKINCFENNSGCVLYCPYSIQVERNSSISSCKHDCRPVYSMIPSCIGAHKSTHYFLYPFSLPWCLHNKLLNIFSSDNAWNLSFCLRRGRCRIGSLNMVFDSVLPQAHHFVTFKLLWLFCFIPFPCFPLFPHLYLSLCCYRLSLETVKVYRKCNFLLTLFLRHY